MHDARRLGRAVGDFAGETLGSARGEADDPPPVGATGEVRYCQSGLPSLVAARQKEAYAAIAQACGGEDKYNIRGEMMADATGSFMGVDVQCQGNAGRAIVFACKGGKPL